MARISEKSLTAVLDGITQPGVKVQAKDRVEVLTLRLLRLHSFTGQSTGQWPRRNEIQLVDRVTPAGGVIDGVINEDRLGLDVIYIQAKR